MSASELRAVAQEVRWARDDLLSMATLPTGHRRSAVNTAIRRLTDAAARLDALQGDVIDDAPRETVCVCSVLDPEDLLAVVEEAVDS